MIEQKVKLENAPTQLDEISNRLDFIMDGNASTDKLGMKYYIKQKFIEMQAEIERKDIQLKYVYLKIDNDLANLQERLKNEKN